MRGVQIFAGTSHPSLSEAICERLGTQPASCELRKFSNGETSVNIGVSVRNQDIYIVQSGSQAINDSVMELLIMIAACKGGSAKSITAVIPYFPYSRQSKKKSHRGAITARMLANLLSVAGVDHVITVDLHASQMQGFFGKPVDNLFAEPLIARWIRINVPSWKDAVVVSKNAGGTKRVTSLADTLKLNFGIVTTERRRHKPAHNNGMTDSSVFFESIESVSEATPKVVGGEEETPKPKLNPTLSRQSTPIGSSPLAQETRAESYSPPVSRTRTLRPQTPPAARRPSELEVDYTDERARDVITGRLVQGHIVDDDYVSPAMSDSGSAHPDNNNNADSFGHDPMTSSFVSTASSFQPEHALGGTFDAAVSSDEEDEAQAGLEQEKTITLVGEVKDKTVFIVDDMIEKPGSWIAAAETVVKRGGAQKVYCIATHGLFSEDALEEMDECECIDHIIITNSFPVSPQSLRQSRKLIILDLSTLLSESIRRHHYGESISALFHLND